MATTIYTDSPEIASTGVVYRQGRRGELNTGVVRPRGSYWSSTRRPLPSLVFVIPLMLAYEIGVVWHTGASPAALRTGADAWMRSALGTLGLTDQWFPPLLLTVVLLIWQVMSPRDWRFAPSILGGMVIESLLLAIALVGLSRLMDLGFSLLDEHPPRLLAVGSSSSRADLGSLIGFLGAGVYEEALFRLALVPVLFGRCEFCKPRRSWPARWR